MDKILIHGGYPLSGSIKVSGSKNSSLPILAATLLTREPCIVHRVPDLSDTHYMLQILIHLGAQVERASGVVTVAAEKIASVAPYDVDRRMRASVCVLGPLLGRCKEATVSLPGGCVIGDRPIDLHLRGFEALGAAVRVEGGNIKVFAPKLRGAIINLAGKFGPTVLGTDNVMMAAVLAEGTTVIENAAQEPEVVDLATLLTAMGARIQGAGTARIEIEGVVELGGAVHRVVPDRVEAGTLIVAAAITGGDVTVTDLVPDHISSVLSKLDEIGVVLEMGPTWVRARCPERPRPADVTTSPFPGFPTDMQAQVMALLGLADGQSRVTETIFENRFMHVAELARMGARIETDGAIAIVRGVPGYQGAPVMASDLRASAALVIAGLAARGTTIVARVYHLDRGYERLEVKLGALGARIVRRA